MMNSMVLANGMKRSGEFVFSEEQLVIERMIVSLESAGVLSEKASQPDPIDYLKKVMAERGLRSADLKGYIGSSGNISAVLNRRKPLSLRMIRNLHRYLKIPAEILIQPYDCC